MPLTSTRQAYPHLPEEYAPRIHRAEVVAVHRIGPGMIRVVLGGADMDDYPTTGIGDEFVRLFFPEHPDYEAPSPFLTDRGWDYPPGAEPSPARIYTIRGHRPGEVDIDFVEHEGGIAAAWAMQARPGQQVALNPPKAIYNRPEHMRRQLLIADEPALPAALRIAELTAADVETHLLLEVRGEKYRLFADAPDAEYTWVCGTGNGRAPSELARMLRRRGVDEETFVWVAAETKATRHIRTYLRQELGRSNESYTWRGYWTDKAEEWRARYDALGEDVRARIQALHASDRDGDEVLDEVQKLYEAAGL